MVQDDGVLVTLIAIVHGLLLIVMDHVIQAFSRGLIILPS